MGESVSSVPMASATRKSAPSRWQTWAALGVCALAVWAVFGGTRHGAFVLWDDDYNLQQNPHLGGLTWENLRWMFTDTAYSRRYFPLTWLGWTVQHDLFGLTPYSAHLGNVLFHLLNTVLVFFVIQSALRIWLAHEDHARGGPATVAATLGALIWALHPLRVEVVAWASGRIYAQTACCLLVSLWCYLKSIECEPGSKSARRYRWVSVAALALSLLTYPLALSYVGVLLVLDWYLPARLRPAPVTPWLQRLRPLLVEKIPFFAVTAVILGLTLWSRTNVAAAGWKPPVTLAEFGVGPRLMQACYVWVYYLGKPLLPFHLSPFYTRLIEFSPGDFEFILSLAVVVLLTGLFFFRRRQWPGLWLLWLCHLLVLAPMLGLTEHPHFTSDRYSYLAAVPWSIGLAVVIVRAWSRRPWRSLVLFASAGAVAAGAALSLAQAAVWRNTETLGLHMIATMGDHPRRFDIYRRISSALREEGRIPESNAYYLKSLAGDPHALEASLGQARKLEEEGKPREALAQYLLAKQLRPDLAEPPYRIGAILLADDRAADALPYLQDAARIAPGQAEIEITLGWALNRAGQAPEAIPHFESALRTLPNDAAAHSGLGTALVAIGREQEAIPHFEAVLRQYPDSAGIREALERIRK
ncbi:MAG: Tetratricopeptide (TPR) repeat [Verrucomicrobia bacterium]|nr:MAG: Tetratricopeptide (TPR) repeat [Verrucomicrobiota bacterium]